MSEDTATGDSLRIETFAAGPFACNCSIVIDPSCKQAIVIDPGGDFEHIIERLAAHDAKVAAIIHTHTHIDHVGATASLAERAQVTPQIHEADRLLYDMLPVQAALVGSAQCEQCHVVGDLLDQRTVTAGGIELGVVHTPGHSPGSVSFLLRKVGGQPQVAFTGDTLFRGSIGRTDLWGGDSDAIMRSLKNRLMCLDDDTCIVPGHGPQSTIGSERQSNPFVR